MPRPPRLKPTKSYPSPDLIATQDGLTPRTPYSARDKEGGASVGQTQPLLVSASSPGFREAYPRTNEKHSRKLSLISRIFAYAPLVLGTLSAFVLLGLVLIAWRRPELLESVVQNSKSGDSSSPPAADDVHDPIYTSPEPAVEPHDHSAFINYTNYTSFPLTPLQYAEECWKQLKDGHDHGAYWSTPPDGVADVEHKPSANGVCKSSVTYMLDGTAGLVAELAVMAQIAGLAREHNKAFFVDDRYWTRGNWSDYFEKNVPSGPEVGCLPPPPDELVACPRQARHWVVTFRTAKFHLGHDFANEFEDAHERGIQRQRTIYMRALESFTLSIRPNPELAALIESMRAELSSAYVSVHIRRGDSRAQSWEYHEKQVPVSQYADAVQRITSTQQVFVASDSPEAEKEFTAALAGSGRNVISLRTSSFSGLQELAYPVEQGYLQKDWRQGGDMRFSLEERVWYTKGMIVDLALLSGLWPTDNMPAIPRSIVCTITSTICKVAALGLGFDRAFGKEIGLDWVEIDAKGNVEPVWSGFGLVF